MGPERDPAHGTPGGCGTPTRVPWSNFSGLPDQPPSVWRQQPHLGQRRAGGGALSCRLDAPYRSAAPPWGESAVPPQSVSSTFHPRSDRGPQVELRGPAAAPARYRSDNAPARDLWRRVHRHEVQRHAGVAPSSPSGMKMFLSTYTSHGSPVIDSMIRARYRNPGLLSCTASRARNAVPDTASSPPVAPMSWARMAPTASPRCTARSGSGNHPHATAALRW